MRYSLSAAIASGLPDAIAGWMGSAGAILSALFNVALLYVSFSKPFVATVKGDLITLSRVPDRFAAVIRGEEASIVMAEFAEAAPRGHDTIPAASVAMPAPPRKQTKNSAPWIAISLATAGLISLLACGIGITFGILS